MQTDVSSYNHQIFSGSALMVFAIVTMLIDHIGAGFLVCWKKAWEPIFAFQLLGTLHTVSLYQLFRLVGRLAFPIFAFLLVEGFCHTSNRRKYAWSLAIFALISEIPFDFLFRPIYGNSQNIYFTLLIGFLTMWGLERYRGRPVFQAIIVAAALAAATVLHTDYSYHGIVLILALYLFRKQPVLQTVFGALSLYFEWFAVFAFIPIRLYNGRRGFVRGRYMKYFFYIFYPVHMGVIALLRRIIFHI